MFILDVVPYIVSPLKQNMKQSKHAGVGPRRTAAGLEFLFQSRGRCGPPCTPPLALPMSNTEKTGGVEGEQDRADEEDGKTRGSESKRGLHKEAQ